MANPPRFRVFLESLWVYVGLALLLTSIIAGVGGMRDGGVLSLLFVGNFVLSVAIGASMHVGFAIQARLGEKTRLPPWPLRFVSLFTFAAAILMGVEVALYALALFSPALASWFPRGAVRMVAVPVSLGMFGVSIFRERARRERALRSATEARLAEARLSALMARTHPHFLFNSLNGIAALVEENPPAAERAILQLSALFRYVLEGADRRSVPISAELAFVRDYLALEALRFGDRLDVTITIDPSLPSLEDVEVPPLSVQPLVENAVRHGVATRPGGGRIEIALKLMGDHVQIEVADDGPGPERSRHQGTGTSQADLALRLSLLYGERARFTTGQSRLGGFRATLELPTHTS